ncbi:hypothetical protein [Actinomadura algeriensis]|uniref:Uncharacterized protein n=1 Tax=Actinomadura algeriensis TaxID=1679523 RepID=A0ABR9K526_9ACTN|nr:hypothetical protein [Actinomadura algeriensis]MBE1537922.1 hypothetical protein [Actinomadura algeriensis]
MFGRAPLEERIARRQAELGPWERGKGPFDQPVAKYLLIASLVVTVAAHVIGGVVLAFMAH